MHLAPFIPTPKQFLADYREVGMRAAVRCCVTMGILGAIYFMWAPSFDELVRRKNEPYYEGVRIRRINSVYRFFSASVLRATPPPRAVHR